MPPRTKSPRKKASHLSPLAEILGPDGVLARELDGYEYRPEQLEACEAIDHSLSQSRHCAVEAGTGVGKTLAYLVPAVRAIARGECVVISTHTISLQTQLLQKDIPLVSRLFPQAAIKAVLMKGRGNYLCLQDLDAGEADLFKATDPIFRKLKAWSRKTETGDVADLPFVFNDWGDIGANVDTCRHQDCRFFERCFYYRMRWQAADANLIVVNHALFLSDLALRQADPASGILPDYSIVIFDEAHHLEDVATGVFGIELSNRRLPHFLDRVKRTRDVDADVARLDALESLNTELFASFDSPRQEFYFGDVLDETGAAAASDRVTQMSVLLDEVQKSLIEQAKEADQPLQDRLNGLARMGARLKEELAAVFFQRPEDEGDEYIRWGRHAAHRTQEESQTRRARYKPRTTLHYTPVSVRRRLEDTLWKSAGTVALTSATLANSGGFSYLRARIGLPENAKECIVGSPFDYTRQALLYVPAHLPAPNAASEDDFSSAASEEVRRLLNVTGGRAFLLFTSRRMMNRLWEVLSESVPFPCFRQGDLPPGQLVDAFRASGNGVLFGTQTFWEGVDIQGDALSCVIIDRLPFAVPDSPITRARTEAIKTAGGDWFNEFSVPQAQIRLKQGFGRLIRTRQDRGIVCILDTRLLTKGYGREFVRYLPPASRASLWPRVERWMSGER